MERLLLVAALTSLIHLINTLIYSVRVSGVRTGRLATAISLFNVIFLISSTANMIQGPILATMVEGLIHRGGLDGAAGGMESPMAFPPAYLRQIGILAGDFRLVILSATMGTLVGALLMPAFVNFFSGLILVFEKVGSVPALLLAVVTSPRRVWCYAVDPPQEPDKKYSAPTFRGLPVAFLVMNVLVTGIFTTGVISALYAGALYPDFRASATMLASVVNGVAQILFATLIDPVAARITDQALEGRREQSDVRRMALYLAVTRLSGTLLAQVLFIPAAYLIRYVAILITVA
ncbi:MAG: hypothetical protein VR68_11405 [Peptococcaceae bacterium BRH_c4a]|nr:MAG: hypothetical protein VR68_11405 [Peptococcaceae bacterium BRH_c4a]